MSKTATTHLLSRSRKGTVPLTPLTAEALPAWLKRQDRRLRAWVESTGFDASAGSTCLLPGEEGGLARVLVGVEQPVDPWAFGGLPLTLPAGSYRVDPEPDAATAEAAALGWTLGGYAFTRYRKPARQPAMLVWPKRGDRAAVEATAAATTLVRDLVNTPAEDMGPGELAAAAKRLGREHGAKVSVVVGDELLKRNYPAIHTVGRAASRAPRLIDLRWGDKGPRITLVGKGVCFDSGGLDLKTASGMKLMKKDMGGAAHALGLAALIMARKLPLRLRVLVPAVENAVSGNAFRPLDVMRTRKGLTVEVGNTDAEGRLVLCDALAEAQSEKPELIVDFATLTGAARVALGPDLPAMFCNDDKTAEALLRCGRAVGDEVWRLPLHQPYKRYFASKVADITNSGDTPFAGAITAALFLQHFVAPETPWVHFDIMAWNPSARPGRPEGGEAMGLRAAFALIAERVARGKVDGKRRA